MTRTLGSDYVPAINSKTKNPGSVSIAAGRLQQLALHLPSTATMREKQEGNLAGKVAIVSGSSSGIGAAIVTELNSRGAYTVVNYPFPHLKHEAERLIAKLDAPAIAVEADLSTISGPQKLVDATVAEWGKIDILVNSAGLAVNKPFEEHTLDDWDLVVNLNGRGTFLLTQAVLKHLTKGSSRIVNIASISSRGSPPGQTVYSGSKGMVDSFTRCWYVLCGFYSDCITPILIENRAKELPPKYGCTVNAVSPGPTKTAGFADAGEEQMKILQPTIDATPAGARLGDPSEIAHAVAFLCEDRARWVNGEHMFVCGGLFID